MDHNFNEELKSLSAKLSEMFPKGVVLMGIYDDVKEDGSPNFGSTFIFSEGHSATTLGLSDNLAYVMRENSLKKWRGEDEES